MNFSEYLDSIGPEMADMVPVPVCEVCDPEITGDDLAPVAVAILGAEDQDFTEHLCLLHLRMLAPATMRTLDAIDPGAFDCSPARYGVRGGKVWVEWLPVGPVATFSDAKGWTSGHGVSHYDNGTPRPYCYECRSYDGWHTGGCSFLK